MVQYGYRLKNRYLKVFWENYFSIFNSVPLLEESYSLAQEITRKAQVVFWETPSPPAVGGAEVSSQGPHTSLTSPYIASDPTLQTLWLLLHWWLSVTAVVPTRLCCSGLSGSLYTSCIAETAGCYLGTVWHSFIISLKFIWKFCNQFP